MPEIVQPCAIGAAAATDDAEHDHSGFATVQKTLTALYNEIRHDADPATLDSLPVSETVWVHAPMAPYVVAKTAAIVAKHLQYLAAIELRGGRAGHRFARIAGAGGRGHKRLTPPYARASHGSMKTAPSGPGHRNRRCVARCGQPLATADLLYAVTAFNNWDQVLVALYRSIV